MANNTTITCKDANRIVAFFFCKIEASKNGMRDIFGIDALEYLIGLLKSINAPRRTWGIIAKYVLKRAGNRITGFYYTNTLVAIAPHVSSPILGQIVSHLAHIGNIEALSHLTKTLLKRGPSFDETLIMATYHHKTWTDPDDKVWERLLSLACKRDVPTITNMRAEVKKHKDEPDFY